MKMSFLSKILGDSHEKYLKEAEPMVEQINGLETQFKVFSDGELREKTQELKKQLNQGQSLDDILPKAFALVRESAKRTLDQRHFDVQLLAGMAMHQGKIVEMKTGEGKTLAATSAAYLNALLGQGVHIVTVNDYLARRDTVWMGQIYHLLGLSVGCIVHDNAYLYDPYFLKENQKPELKAENQNEEPRDNKRDEERDVLGGFKVVESYLRPVARKEAYLADITYGTNNEFGFDYLRDNMAYRPKEQAQRDFSFAILDEIDSILIDEARTPLIISAPDMGASKSYQKFAKIIPSLNEKADYEIDEERRVVTLTEQGINRVENILGIKNIYVQEGIDYLHHLEQSLRANVLFKKDRDYVVKDGKIIIVDEFTGRLMPGRRWSGGLHQAVEAKEGVEIQPESRTFATITFQNYFKLYPKLAGMTGTAITSAEEFDKVYNLDVVSVPTNRPLIRKDLADKVFKTEKGKFGALVQEIKERHQKGQPILVGTRSIEKNEYLARLLEGEGVPCQVLNAKHHEKEAGIIAQAGKLGAITVATNMAGRGVDIILGGYPPSESKVKSSKLKVKENGLYKKWEEEQKKVIALGGLHVIGTERHEARRIDDQLRGRSGRQGDPGSSQFFLCLGDDLLRIFGGERMKNLMEKLKIPENEVIEAALVSRAVEAAQAKIEGVHFDVRKNLLDYDNVFSRHRQVFYQKRNDVLKASIDELKERVVSLWEENGFSKEELEKKELEIGENFWPGARIIFLRTLDFYWLSHLEDMDWLKESVRLEAYAKGDPLVEYKTRGYRIFQEMIKEAEISFVNAISKLGAIQEKRVEVRPLPVSGEGESLREGAEAKVQHSSIKKKTKIGRNAPCPCGKINPRTQKPQKYKRCCWLKQKSSLS